MRRLYADRLVVISAVLILLFSVLFAVVQSSADPANKMATPHCVQETIRPPASSADGAIEAAAIAFRTDGRFEAHRRAAPAATSPAATGRPWLIGLSAVRGLYHT